MRKTWNNFVLRVKVLFTAIRLIKDADSKLFFFLCFIVSISTILPVLAIKSSADIINNIVSQNEEFRLYSSILLWSLVLFAHDIISPIISFLQSNLADKTVFFINKSIINKSNTLMGLEYFENPQFYNDLQIITSNSHSKPINLVVTLIGILRDSCLIIYCMSLLFFNISFISFIILVCVILQTKISTKIQTDIWCESLGRSLRSRMMNYISSLMINRSFAKEIRLFPIGKYLYNKYITYFNLIYTSMFKLRLKLIIWPIIPSIFLLLGNFFVLKETIILISNHTLKVGSIAIIIQCFMQLHTTILSIGEQSGWMSGHLLFFEKYFSFLSKNDLRPKERVILEKTQDFCINSIKFEKVSFTYSDGRIALKNIHFEISNFDRLAIVGANGAGKTTIIKLICGFYKPTSGKIFINNFPLEDYDIKQIREFIAPVFQDFGAYALSIRENIEMGSPSEERNLEQILRFAGADFVYDLPNGINQQLDKAFEGTDLSLGQWQKIAIARAINKGGDLFILDEPTASLDPVSEHEVFENFSKICSNKLVIFVTHRLSTIGMANKILLLDDGNQIGFDSHDNLMLTSQLYQRMFNSQASKFLNLKNNVRN